MLTDEQIDIDRPTASARLGDADALAGATPPPYAATSAATPQRGAAGVTRRYCASLPRRRTARAAPKAGSIVDDSYLALVSDQGLRTIVITGRPISAQPDWRGNVPGRPMTDAGDLRRRRVARVAARATSRASRIRAD